MQLDGGAAYLVGQWIGFNSAALIFVVGVALVFACRGRSRRQQSGIRSGGGRDPAAHTDRGRAMAAAGGAAAATDSAAVVAADDAGLQQPAPERVHTAASRVERRTSQVHQSRQSIRLGSTLDIE